jgi:hypothetical protein
MEEILQDAFLAYEVDTTLYLLKEIEDVIG